MMNRLSHSNLPPTPITTPAVSTGKDLFTCKCHTAVTVPWPPAAVYARCGSTAWPPLRLIITLLLLEFPELGLDGDSRLLGLRIFHVDVKVLWDVCLGRIWKEKEIGWMDVMHFILYIWL